MSKANNIIDLLEVGIRAETLRQKAIDPKGRVDLAQVEPFVYQPRRSPVKANGNDVSLEEEVGAMVKNTLRHRAYLRLLNKKYEQIKLAISTRE